MFLKLQKQKQKEKAHAYLDDMNILAQSWIRGTSNPLL